MSGRDVVEDEGVEGLVVEPPQLGADEVALRAFLDQAEDVAGGDGEDGLPRLRLQLLDRLPGLGDPQAVDLDLARTARQQLAADGRPDQSVPPEHEDLPIFNVQSKLSYWFPSGS
jgi:hypothetical protein